MMGSKFIRNFLTDNKRCFNISFNSSIHYFLLTQSLVVLVSTDSKYFTKSFYLTSSNWSKFFLLQKITAPNNLSIIVDGAQFKFNNLSWNLQFNTTSMLFDDRVSVYTTVSLNNFCLTSVSSIYNSCVWLERELSDFTNINFLGLSDTRRLLLDYFEDKTLWSTHISNDKNFNNVLYDITLSY